MAEVSTADKTSDTNHTHNPTRSRDRPIVRAATTPVEPGSSGSASTSTDAVKPPLVKSSLSAPIGMRCNNVKNVLLLEATAGGGVLHAPAACRLPSRNLLG